jgi:hypothetical protein
MSWAIHTQGGNAYPVSIVASEACIAGLVTAEGIGSMI